MLKKIITVFGLGWLLNIIWENLHSSLYIHYQTAEITKFILFQAALFDGAFIALAFFLVFKIAALKNKLLWLVIIGLVGATLIELYALNTNRWAYGPAMPIIPILNIGLSPLVQLALTSAIIYKIIKFTKSTVWRELWRCHGSNLQDWRIVPWKLYLFWLL